MSGKNRRTWCFIVLLLHTVLFRFAITHGAFSFCSYARCFFVLLLYIWCFFVLHTVLFRFAPTHGAFSLNTVLFRFNEKAPWQRRFLPGNRLRPLYYTRCSRCFTVLAVLFRDAQRLTVFQSTQYFPKTPKIIWWARFDVIQNRLLIFSSLVDVASFFSLFSRQIH